MSDQSFLEKEWSVSQLSGQNSAYLEVMYEQYLENKTEIDESWVKYFDSLQDGESDVKHSDIKEAFIELTRKPTSIIQSSTSSNLSNDKVFPDGGNKVSALMDLIYSYRAGGHKKAKLDPLGILKGHSAPELDLCFHNLGKEDLEDKFHAGIFSNNKEMKVKDVLEHLKQVYCGSIGYEYMHITDMNEKLWLRERIETEPKKFSNDEKKWILERLSASEGLEKYLGMKYVGQKRFSIEGGESLIPALDKIISKSSDLGIEEVFMGMAHRGRLNVLVNILGKLPDQLFGEFEGRYGKKRLLGDVKYHQGYSNYYKTENKDIHLSLAFNPSHLETVDPVVEGAVRAKQDKRRKDDNDSKNRVLPILMHGDSAFCGQGIIMENFALSQTRYYGTGGTIHIISNNQVGFTTNKKEDNRSSLYSTDIAKFVECPIFHVNGDDPEAVVRVAELAIEYRMKFNKDVVIDLMCYRRPGHNESDEPSGTQPEMYSIIKKLPTTKTLYSNKLKVEKVLTEDEIKKIAQDYRKKLDNNEVVANISKKEHKKEDYYLSDWRKYVNKSWRDSYNSNFDKKELIKIANQLCDIPENLKLQTQVKKTIKDRKRMANEEIPGNWGFAENLAYATLVKQGYNIRLSGEDSGRGTFSHRHAVLHNQDYKNELKEYIPLREVNKDVLCNVIDSILSEYAVLGYEYGYSCSDPETLTIWEAQFGDFANTAQVVIDQFICSAEEKWGILSGLVLLLPHGQEGAGPEHSSARLERFLQLCANENMQICIPTTPAQIFHLLRRQVLRQYRKPLIIMSPKSLLRHHLVTSTMDELANESFKNIIGEVSNINTNNVTRVVLCSGKVYYDLFARRKEENIKDVAIIRVEQLYPLPKDELSLIFHTYSHVTDIVWTQEEPENQGSWWAIQHELRKVLLKKQQLSYVGRVASASPATGYASIFQAQQKDLVEQALKIK